MENDSSLRRSQKILKLTLEIIYLLTGEDYTIVKKTSEEAIMIPQPTSLMHKNNYDKKILHLTDQIIRLISGQVPLRCEDVTMYFSIEEWDYVEGHKSLYKDIMMDGDQLSSLGKHYNRNIMVEHAIVSSDYTWESEEMIEKPQCHNFNIPPPTTALFPEDLSLDYPAHLGPSLDTSDGTPKSEGSFTHPEPNETVNQNPTFTHLSLNSLRQSRSPPDVIDSIPRSTDILVHPKPNECVIQNSTFISQKTLNTSDKTFPCAKCGKFFKDKNSLSIHIKTHTGKWSLSCSDCGKSFIHRRSLLDHRRIHTGEKPFPCSECGKCFRHKVGLQSHKRTHTGEKQYGCLECGRFFSSKTALNRHRRTHSGEKPLSCSDCGMSFTQKEYLAEHQKIHTGERPFSCFYCEKSFTHESTLTQHQSVCPANKSCRQPKQTTEDHEIFSPEHLNKDKVIRQEFKADHPNTPLLFPDAFISDLPSDSLPYWRSLSDTVDNIPRSTELPNCVIQNPSFISKNTVYSFKKNFPCPECEKCFKQKKSLSVHMKSHTGERPLSCSECGKSFIHKRSLLDHERIHTGEKPFTCSECGKCFRHKVGLQSHQRTHTGEKPYGCSECGRFFAGKTALNRHRRTHAGEKPFACPECGKCFRHKVSLLRHQGTHMREKPYGCLECGKQFSGKMDLIWHQRTHTGERPEVRFKQ